MRGPRKANRRRCSQQLFREQQSTCQQQLDRRDAQLFLDDAANLSRAELELVGDRLESRLLVEVSLLETLNDQLRNPLCIVNWRVAGR